MGTFGAPLRHPQKPWLKDAPLVIRRYVAWLYGYFAVNQKKKNKIFEILIMDTKGSQFGKNRVMQNASSSGLQALKKKRRGFV